MLLPSDFELSGAACNAVVMFYSAPKVISVRIEPLLGVCEFSTEVLGRESDSRSDFPFAVHRNSR